MAYQVLLELSKHTINITKFEEVTLTWHEYYLTLLTEKGVHIFECSHNIRCLDKKIDCIETFIANPKYSPTESLFSDKFVNSEIRNVELTEMIVDHTMWPHNSQLLAEMSSIVNFKWSPAGAVNNYDSAIALLTNVGVVEIHVQNLYNWECAIEISSLLYKESMSNMNKPKDLTSLKEMVHMLATTAMCWSPILNPDNTSYFITAQKNGNIILWKIQCRESNATAKLIGSFESGTCEIVSMLWIQKHSEEFLIICTNVFGQVIAFDCRLQNNILQLINPYTLWPDKDRMISKFLQYTEMDNKIILTCNKHRYLLVLMFDKKCNMLGNYINNMNDHRITSINKSGNDIHITTVNCKIFKLNLGMNGEELDISLSAIDYNGLTTTHELHNIAYSPNKTLCVVCAVDRKVNCRKEPLKVEIIFTSTKEHLDSLLEILLLNPRKSLANYWDVIEVLRYKTMKTKLPPPVEYGHLYEMACSDIYMLKLYYIFSSLCDVLRKIFKLGLDFHLPESSVNNVKEEILVAHADKVIHKYYNKYQHEGRLDDCDIEYFLGAKKFLQYFFQKSNKKLTEVIDANILSIVEHDSSYLCQCCDLEVLGFRCENEHFNMFCALTFTPIDSNSYLVCKWCNLTARKELYSENPSCLFCDINLKLVTE